MSYLKSVGTSFIYIVFVLSLITFWPGLRPSGNIFTEYSIKPPAKLEGVLSNNERLNGAEKLFEGQIKGAESFDYYNGELYTGMHGGYVGKIVGDKIVPIVKFGKECDGIVEEEKCGRPLGLKFDKKGQLYVVDAYYGIFKVDVNTGKYEKLVDVSQPIDGEVPMFPNSIDVADNGDFYWTDATSQHKLYDGLMAMFTDPVGRLIRYNAATKKNEVLLKGLGFANGLKLSDDESYVLVAETLKSTIIKYHLKGSKSGKSEILLAGLPGNPDNIHSDSLGNYFVSLIVPADPEHPQLSQTLIPHPNLRKLIVRLMSLIELPFSSLNNIYPNDITKKIVHTIGSFETFRLIMPQKVTIIRFDGNGNILDVLHNTDEKISGISSAIVYDNYLWLGSPFNEYIARVPLKKAFPNVKFPSNTERKIITEKKIEKPVTKKVETPKPTTPKPIQTEAPKPKIPKVEEVKPILKEQKENFKKQAENVPKKVVEDKKVPKKVEESKELPKPVKQTTPKPPKKDEVKVEKQPEVPKKQKQPEVSKVQKQPEVPKVQRQPEVPKVQKPEVPKVQKPEVPKVQKPEVPKVQKPEVPKVQKPEVPKLQKPEVPKVQKQPEVIEEPEELEFIEDLEEPAFDDELEPEVPREKGDSESQNTKFDDEM